MINGKNIAPLPFEPPPESAGALPDMTLLGKPGADVVHSLAAPCAGSPDEHRRDSPAMESLFLLKKWKIPPLGRCHCVFSRCSEVQPWFDLTHFCWRPGFGVEKRPSLWCEAAHWPLCSPLLHQRSVLQSPPGPPGGTMIALKKPPRPHRRHGLYFAKHVLENG